MNVRHIQPPLRKTRDSISLAFWLGFVLSVFLVALGAIAPNNYTTIIAAAGMGGVSLFPLWGHLQSLKGFYPPHKKEWFIYLPTIIAMGPYIFLQFFFEELPVYVSLWKAFAVGIVGLLGYVTVLVASKNVESRRRKRGKADNVLGKVYVVVPLLVLFILFTVSFTYTFNVLENLLVYDVLYGKVVVDGKPASGATVTFHSSFRPQKQTVRTNTRGKYHLIMQKSRFRQLNGMEVRWSAPDNTPKVKAYEKSELVRGWMQVEIL